MKNKNLLLAIFSMTFFTNLVIASDVYKSPSIAMKDVKPVKHTSMHTDEEKFKVEGASDSSRGLASEKEVVDREPTAVVKPEEEHMDSKPAPKFWKHLDKN